MEVSNLINNVGNIADEIANKKEIFAKTIMMMLSQESKNSFTVKGVDFDIGGIIRINSGSLTISTQTRKVNNATKGP